MNGNRVHAQQIKGRLHISQIGATNIGTLGIQNDRDARVCLLDVAHRSLQSAEALVSPRLIKGRVGLVGADQIVRGINNGPVEREKRVLGQSIFLQRRRNAVVVRVQ